MYGMLQTAFQPSCMNQASVFEGYKRFKEGRESVRNDERRGRSKEVSRPELIGQIKNFMDKDRHVSIETISTQFDVSVGTVHTIIHKKLNMCKICTNFVPRVLREDQKERCCHDSREMVELINLDPTVLDALVTCDESWIYCYDQETEFPVEAYWLSQTQEGQTEQIHPKTLDDPFFWQHWHDLYALGSHWTDSQQGILCWGFKASTLKIESVAFPPGNTPVHNSILVTDYLTKVGIKTVPQPPYSPDLAPCDFFLFPKLRGCRYETIEEMKEAVMKVIDTLTQEDFHGVGPSRNCWNGRTRALQLKEKTLKGTRV